MYIFAIERKDDQDRITFKDEIPLNENWQTNLQSLLKDNPIPGLTSYVLYEIKRDLHAEWTFKEHKFRAEICYVQVVKSDEASQSKLSSGVVLLDSFGREI